MQCTNCGDVVDPRRVELGYDYCLKEECQQSCLKRVELAAVGVNKAADYYMKAEEVVPPRPAAGKGAAGGAPEETRSGEEELAQAGGAPGAPIRPQPVVNRERRAKTTIERLREQEQALDQALDRSYERFRRGEITAIEMHRERDRLVDAFNRQVLRENIRYRSMLRGPANRAG